MADASVHDGAKLHIEDWPWQIRTGRREHILLYFF